MNVDLIDMNAFVMDDEDVPQATKASGGSDTDRSDSGMTNTVDFLADDEVGLRDHSEARVLTPIANPYNQEEKPKMNLVRDGGQESFL